MKAPSSSHEHFLVIDQMTNCDLKITQAFNWFYKEKVAGNFKEIFPSIAKIAQMAKCCIRSVTTYIQKYEGIVISHERRRDFETMICKSNIYHLNSNFFDHVVLMEITGHFSKFINNVKYKLKSIKKDVLENLVKNSNFFIDFVYGNKAVMNNPIAHGFLPKLPTIGAFFLRTAYTSFVQEEKSTSSMNNQKKEQDNLFKKFKLTEASKRNIIDSFGRRHIKEAIKIAEHESIKGNLSNPGGFIYGVCKKLSMRFLSKETKKYRPKKDPIVKFTSSRSDIPLSEFIPDFIDQNPVRDSNSKPSDIFIHNMNWAKNYKNNSFAFCSDGVFSFNESSVIYYEDVDFKEKLQKTIQ